MIDPEDFWDVPEPRDEDDEHGGPPERAPKGTTAKALARWESRHGVALPEPLRSALLLQNGGSVRDSAIEVDPLKEIAPVDEDFWEDTELAADEAPDRSRVFTWGRNYATGGSLLLNLNGDGPTVLLDGGDGSVADLGPIERYIAAERSATGDAPALSWAEAEGQAEILGRETVIAHFGGRPTTRDQILARAGAGLVLFVRERSGDEEKLQRIELPLPLAADRTAVEAIRLAPDAIYGLRLRPRRAVAARSVRSYTFGGGRWTNQSNTGLPTRTRFEARDRARLDALRVVLLGVEAAAEAAALDKIPVAASPGTSLPEQAQARLLGLLMASMPADQRETLISESVEQAVRRVAGGGESIPPELTEAARAARERLADALRPSRPATPADSPDAGPRDRNPAATGNCPDDPGPDGR